VTGVQTCALPICADPGLAVGGTLIAAPMAWTHEDRVAQLRRLAELAA